MRPQRGVFFLVGLHLLGSGCAGAYRFGAGPTLDTEGRLGYQAYVGGSFGLALDEDIALEESIAVDVGGQIAPAGFALSPTLGLDYVSEAEEGSLAWRVGFRGRFHFVFEQERTRAEIASGLAFALMPVIDDDDGDKFRHLGMEASAYLLTPMDTEDRSMAGYFALSAVYEFRFITELDDMFPGKH
jgi:hypothetical protein